MNDEALVRAFRNGSDEAFTELVRRHSRPLTTMILRITRDEEEAKDISQTVFMKAYTGLSRFIMASSFKTWLYSIALNAVRDHLRRRRPQISSEDVEGLADHAASTGERLDRARMLKRVREAIEDLPRKQRLTLEMRIYEGMEYSRIAASLGGTAGGARANFFHAVKALRQRLGEEE
ncbi:MAG: sigma-70 family RNA polymerase sigma factor [Desulfomonilaceae bacterium]|nr:sigma-70 family RNA polymerase sigma factor [Desulfomonilaceae bacterium]